MKEAPKNHQSHARSFADACMGKGKTNSPFSVGGTLTQVLSLGTICQQLNTDLEFDRTTKKFIGNDLANELLAPPTRKGWESYYKMV
jgi:hypothetical protein